MTKKLVIEIDADAVNGCPRELSQILIQLAREIYGHPVDDVRAPTPNSKGVVEALKFQGTGPDSSTDDLGIPTLIDVRIVDGDMPPFEMNPDDCDEISKVYHG